MSNAQSNRAGNPFKRVRRRTVFDREARRIAKRMLPKTDADFDALRRAQAKRERRAERNRANNSPPEVRSEGGKLLGHVERSWHDDDGIHIEASLTEAGRAYLDGTQSPQAADWRKK